MNGRWIFGSDGKSRDFFYLTYDVPANQWACVRIRSNPSYALAVSADGWKDGRITFSGDSSWLDGRHFRLRTTLVRRNARSFTLYDEEQLPDGAWIPDEQIEFTRAR